MYVCMHVCMYVCNVCIHPLLHRPNHIELNSQLAKHDCRGPKVCMTRDVKFLSSGWASVVVARPACRPLPILAVVESLAAALERPLCPSVSNARNRNDYTGDS